MNYVTPEMRKELEPCSNCGGTDWENSNKLNGIAYRGIVARTCKTCGRSEIRDRRGNWCGVESKQVEWDR